MSIRESGNLSEKMADAKLTPKWLLALFCIASTLTVLALGYFGYHFIQLEDQKSEAFENGKEQVILDLKGYFDEHPEVYNDFSSLVKRAGACSKSKVGMRPMEFLLYAYLPEHYKNSIGSTRR